MSPSLKNEFSNKKSFSEGMTKNLKPSQRFVLAPIQWVDMWLNKALEGILLSVLVVEDIWPLHVYMVEFT